MDYKVGQVFYLVGSETAKVIPFMVIEEVTRTTLEGIEKSYIAQLPNEDKTTVDVSKLKGEVFDNLESLRSQMVANAKLAIESMIQDATSIAKVAYNLPEEVQNEVAVVAQPEELSLNPRAAKDNKMSEGEGFEVIGKDEVVKEEETNVQAVVTDDIVKVEIGNGVIANMKVEDLEKVTRT